MGNNDYKVDTYPRQCKGTVKEGIRKVGMNRRLGKLGDGLGKICQNGISSTPDTDQF